MGRHSAFHACHRHLRRSWSFFTATDPCVSRRYACDPVKLQLFFLECTNGDRSSLLVIGRTDHDRAAVVAGKDLRQHSQFTRCAIEHPLSMRRVPFLGGTSALTRYVHGYEHENVLSQANVAPRVKQDIGTYEVDRRSIDKAIITLYRRCEGRMGRGP
ncbi:hypothetical protein FA95DRAFT_103770 [Auriscalpium vulgare]|uniref:Uncharacterized protein n=1 Tax=Auriscalpium vulgare TaxID=40419 RepID=A0ACB8RND7_9AGAM|nr:hypothetical protein FA95DRAFT_103770 [Auriscalpium vulgare]